MALGRFQYAMFDAGYYPIAVLSCMVFLYMYKKVSPEVSAKLFPGYSCLSLTKQIDWNTRVNSSIHAVIVSTICGYTLMYDDNVNRDPIWCDSPTVRATCSIVIGYMASDLIIMTIHFKHIGEVFFYCHHAASMYAFFYVMNYGILPYFANFRLMAELSTPFVNQRWFLDALGHSKSSPMVVTNGISMMVVFFLSRIVSMPFYWHKCYVVYGTEAFTRLGNMQYVPYIACFVLDIINIYWFYKICKGIRKVLAQNKANNTGNTSIKFKTT